MKKSKRITLLCLTTILSGFLAGCDVHPNHLRQRHNADGTLMYDKDGNAIYEDDDKQYYTFYTGRYYPWYTRNNGYVTIPGSGISAPDVGGGFSSESVSSRSGGVSTNVSRGGFGATGEAHASGGFGGGE